MDKNHHVTPNRRRKVMCNVIKAVAGSFAKFVQNELSSRSDSRYGETFELVGHLLGASSSTFNQIWCRWSPRSAGKPSAPGRPPRIGAFPVTGSCHGAAVLLLRRSGLQRVEVQSS